MQNKRQIKKIYHMKTIENIRIYYNISWGHANFRSIYSSTWSLSFNRIVGPNNLLPEKTFI